MMPHALFRIGLTLIALVTMNAPVFATPSTSVFVMSIRGISNGTVTLQADATADRYAISALIQSTGLIKCVRNFSYLGMAQGQIADGRFQPEHYVETANTGRRTSEVEMVYSAGVPRVFRYVSPRQAGPDTPDPATQGGTLDPLSAMFVMLRDRPVTGACDLQLMLFDGRRRSHIIMFPGQSEDNEVRCRGEYRRLEGFTAKEISRHVAFPIEVILDPIGNEMLRVRRVTFQSLYGIAALDRQ